MILAENGYFDSPLGIQFHLSELKLMNNITKDLRKQQCYKFTSKRIGSKGTLDFEELELQLNLTFINVRDGKSIFYMTPDKVGWGFLEMVHLAASSEDNSFGMANLMEA